MSTTLAKPARLKAEIRLAQAVSEFQKDLSAEQKARFSAFRAQSQKRPPDANDVMQLTAEIDRCEVSGGRCVGPRFMSFLQGVQQFAALGDIIVGGSQNIIACGVWSLVRLSLLMIVTSSSYLEKLSTLLMIVGRSAPRYRFMALLYPRSEELQDHLFEYFIVVVYLCHRILKFTQKSKFGQIASSLNDVELKSYQSQLELWASTIKEDVNILMAKSIEDERYENSCFRALSSMFSKSVLLRQNIMAKQQVLDSCSTFNYQTAWKQTRRVGNTTLFNRDAEYQAWKRSTTSCTLVYIGKLGSGKSVLMANMVDDLQLHVGRKDIPVAYFFCRHDLPQSLKARTVIGCLARQLVAIIPDLAIHTASLIDTCATLDIKDILKLLQRVFRPHLTAYFVVDGLDDCPVQERKTVLQQLKTLQDKFRLRICVSLRLEPETMLDLKSRDYCAIKTATIPETNPDIEAFIGVELTSCIAAGKLVLRDPTLIIEIQDALVQGSQGMFLWVALQIEALCAMKTDDAIRQALADLPKDLSETYSRILRRVEEPGRNYQQRILELVLIACRPLTIEELREALSVTPGDTTWNPAKLINDIFSTLACCGSLITVDEEELTVRLMHHSVKQFLLGGLRDSNEMRFTTIESANKTMAAIAVTYLNYGTFGNQVSTAAVPQILIRPPLPWIVRSTIDSSSLVQNVALKLLMSRKSGDFDIGRTLADRSRFYTSRSADEFHFHNYAKSYCLQHTICASEQEPVMNRLLLSLLKGNIVSANGTVENGRTPLLWAIEMGRQAVIKALLDSGNIEALLGDNSGRTPLSLAVRMGHQAIVKLLLNSSIIEVNQVDNSGRTPLSRAAEMGHEAIVEALLNSSNVDINLKDDWGRTPLSWAAEMGREAIVKLLLNSNGVDVNLKDELGRTPLSCAARMGREAIVKLLLNSNGVDVNLKDNSNSTPLSRAVENGHEAIIRLLLNSNVEVNSKDKAGYTPLLRAVQRRHKAIVKLLLDSSKVQADLKDNTGRIPLSLAAQEEHEAIVKLLLESNTDVNSKDTHG